MSTHRKCAKCSHFAVIGQDHCPKHGGVIPKTIAEYEERKNDRLITGAQFLGSNGHPVLTPEPEDDKLRKVRETLSGRLSRLVIDSDDSEFEEGWAYGAKEAYEDALRLLDSL